MHINGNMEGAITLLNRLGKQFDLRLPMTEEAVRI